MGLVAELLLWLLFSVTFFGFGCCANSVDDVAVYCVHLFKCLI